MVREMRRKRAVQVLWLTCLAFLLLLWLPRRVAAQELVAEEDVYIDNMDVSGMNEEQITQVVNEK